LDPGALRDATFLIDEASLLVQTTRPETIGGSTTPSAGEPDRRLPDDLLVIDLNTGKVAERHALPVAVGPEAFPSPVVGHELKAVLPDGLMFVAGGPQLRPAALERLDRTTGGLTTVTTITGDISYLALRGQS
jgi:hypothetical protein